MHFVKILTIGKQKRGAYAPRDTRCEPAAHGEQAHLTPWCTASYAFRSG